MGLIDLLWKNCLLNVTTETNQNISEMEINRQVNESEIKNYMTEKAKLNVTKLVS